MEIIVFSKAWAQPRLMGNVIEQILGQDLDGWRSHKNLQAINMVEGGRRKAKGKRQKAEGRRRKAES
jgi:hypothetical protein